jgi:hypothetical protein
VAPCWPRNDPRNVAATHRWSPAAVEEVCVAVPVVVTELLDVAVPGEAVSVTVVMVLVEPPPHPPSASAATTAAGRANRTRAGEGIP